MQMKCQCLMVCLCQFFLKHWNGFITQNLSESYENNFMFKFGFIVHILSVVHSIFCLATNWIIHQSP